MLNKYQILLKDYALFSHLPWEGKAVDSFVDKVFEGDRAYFPHDHVIVNTRLGIVELSMTEAEAKYVQEKGYYLETVDTRLPKLLDELPPLNASVDHIDNFKTVNLNADPQMVEYYKPTGIYRHTFDGYEGIIEEPLIQPHFPEYGIDKAHKRNNKGAGGKAVIIDTPCDHNMPGHIQIPIVDSLHCEGQFTLHGCETLGDVGARDIGIGIYGVAPECDLYAANYAYVAEAVLWAIDLGADVIVMSFEKDSPTLSERLAVKMASDNGIMVFVAAGNTKSGDGTPAPVNPLSQIQGATAVGALYGGGINAFRDEWVYDSLIGRIPFAAGATTITCCPDPDLSVQSTRNNQERGSSRTNGFMGGVGILHKADNPTLHGKIQINLMRAEGVTVTIANVTTTKPKNLF